MTLRAFFQIPMVKFWVHVFLIVGLAVNAWQLYRTFDMQRKINAESRILAVLQQENNDSRNQRDYYTSDLYKEKYAKLQNFKKNGEQVVDTSVIESAEANSTSTYIPEDGNQNQTNVEKWWSYLMGKE
jgi:hypothetical protein